MKRKILRGLYSPELLESRIAPAIFIVNSLLDDGDGTKTTLREAIAAANLLIGTDTIVFDKSLPAGTINLLMANGEIPITGPLKIKGPGIGKLSVSGGDQIRIFKIDYTVASVVPTTISGLTLTDGKSSGDGGALYSKEALTLKNVVVRSSYAGVDGGGVAVVTDGKISITGCRIIHNQANVEGGGAYLIGDAGISIVKTTLADNTSATEGALYAGASGARAVVLIDNCLVANNSATSNDTGGLTLDADGGGKVIVRNSLITGNSTVGSGGGLTVSNDANGLITHTTFSNNSATTGGAIASNDAATLSITGSRFIGNRATAGGDGGALYLAGTKPVKVAGSLFSGNTSDGDGGAIAAKSSLAVGISRSSFLGNAAGAGGGALAVGDGAVLTMKSSVLTGNSAGDGGGALFGFDGSVLNLTGDKFLENRSGDSGGALYLIANLTASKANLSGNLFRGNVAGSSGGAIFATNDCVFTSTSDKITLNVATSQGGGVYLENTGGIVITSSLFQANVAGSSGGGAVIGASATLTSLKVLENLAGPLGRGGGLRISAGTVVITNSLVTGNVASDGGGVFFTVGTTTYDDATKIFGNVAGINTNIGSA